PAEENPQQSATLQIPYLRRGVPACRKQFASIREETDGTDQRLVPLEYRHRLVSRDIPDPDRPVHAAGGQLLAVRAKGQAGDRLRVPLERPDQLASLAIPQVHIRRLERHERPATRRRDPL